MPKYNYRNFPSLEAGRAAAMAEQAPIYGIVAGTQYFFNMQGEHSFVEEVENPEPVKPAAPSLSDHFHTEEFHNFGEEPETVWKLRAIATGPNCVSGADRFKELIDANWYYMHKVTLTNAASSELVTCWRTVLITKALVAYAFVSDGVATDVARMAETYKGEWDGNIPPLKVVEQKTGSGTSVLKLVPQFKK